MPFFHLLVLLLREWFHAPGGKTCHTLQAALEMLHLWFSCCSAGHCRVPPCLAKMGKSQVAVAFPVSSHTGDGELALVLPPQRPLAFSLLLEWIWTLVPLQFHPLIQFLSPQPLQGLEMPGLLGVLLPTSKLALFEPKPFLKPIFSLLPDLNSLLQLGWCRCPEESLPGSAVSFLAVIQGWKSWDGDPRVVMLGYRHISIPEECNQACCQC